MLNQKTGNGRTTVPMTSRQTRQTQTALSDVYTVVIMPSILGKLDAFGGTRSSPAALLFIGDAVVQLLDLRDRSSWESEDGSSIQDQYLSARSPHLSVLDKHPDSRTPNQFLRKRKRICPDTLQMLLSPACAPACAEANEKVCCESWP